MLKVCICFILTVVFSFLGYTSFMTKDYAPLKEWMAYYTEYKALQNALTKGTANKAELLDKLKTMYPEQAKELERKLKERNTASPALSEEQPDEPHTSSSQQHPSVSQDRASHIQQDTPSGKETASQKPRKNP